MWILGHSSLARSIEVYTLKTEFAGLQAALVLVILHSCSHSFATKLFGAEQKHALAIGWVK